MEIQFLDFDEIIVMQDGQVISSNVATTDTPEELAA